MLGKKSVYFLPRGAHMHPRGRICATDQTDYEKVLVKHYYLWTMNELQEIHSYHMFIFKNTILLLTWLPYSIILLWHLNNSATGRKLKSMAKKVSLLFLLSHRQFLRESENLTTINRSKSMKLRKMCASMALCWVGCNNK